MSGIALGASLPHIQQRAITAVRASEQRRAVCKLTGEELTRRAKRLLINSTTLDAALSGDEEAAAELSWNNKDPSGLGLAALAAYWLGTSTPAYQELLRVGWSRDWLGMVHDGDRNAGFIRRLFRAARYEHDLCGKLRIYRGTSGIDPVKAAGGVAWTTNRDVACWFAFRNDAESDSVVVSACVDDSEVVFYDNSRFEAEVILRRKVSAIRDPGPSTWREAAERYASTIR